MKTEAKINKEALSTLFEKTWVTHIKHGNFEVIFPWPRHLSDSKNLLSISLVFVVLRMKETFLLRRRL